MPRARRVDTTLGMVGLFSTMLLVAAAHRNRVRVKPRRPRRKSLRHSPRLTRIFAQTGLQSRSASVASPPKSFSKTIANGPQRHKLPMRDADMSRAHPQPQRRISPPVAGAFLCLALARTSPSAHRPSNNHGTYRRKRNGFGSPLGQPGQ
jgi:hypothetical protein